MQKKQKQSAYITNRTMFLSLSLLMYARCVQIVVWKSYSKPNERLVYFIYYKLKLEAERKFFGCKTCHVKFSVPRKFHLYFTLSHTRLPQLIINYKLNYLKLSLSHTFTFFFILIYIQPKLIRHYFRILDSPP
jgi:hypothetical protein